MRLSQVLVVITASFLITSEALSATADSKQAKISTVAAFGGPSQRFLTTHYQPAEDDESDESEDSEERGINLTSTQLQELKEYPATLGIKAQKALTKPEYLRKFSQENIDLYWAKLNALKAANTKHGPSMIAYENMGKFVKSE